MADLESDNAFGDADKDTDGFFTSQWYVAQNKQGTISDIVSERDRYRKVTDGSGKAPEAGTNIEAWSYSKSDRKLYTVHQIYVGNNNTNNFDVEINSYYDLRTIINSVDLNDGRIRSYTAVQKVYLSSSASPTGSGSGTGTITGKTNVYFDAHYGWRPVIIYAQGRKVTVGIYKDAQCTQLANMNSATENWLQLSAYPNYTEVVRNGGANVLTNQIETNIFVPTRFKLYLYADEYITDENGVITDPEFDRNKVYNAATNYLLTNFVSERTLYVKVTTEDITAEGTSQKREGKYTIKQKQGHYVGLFGGEIENGQYTEGLIIDAFNENNFQIDDEIATASYMYSGYYNVMTNKYAEGYPGKRYYGGCECVDVIENLAIERAKKLFGCDYANVQPHSGAQANMAVQFAVLKPGDTIMGMNLDHGGHLTHGSPVNMSGKYFHVVPYGVDDNGFLDYDRMRELALECRPKMIIAGASAYARTIDFKKFREVADEVGAVLMVDMAHIAGLVAAGLHPSPIPYADVVTTTTHKTLRGPRGGMILCNKEANEKFNFNKAIFPGIQGGPLMHVIAAKAVCFEEALSDDFKVYQKNIVDNAQALCKGLMSRDIKIVSGGTDNHLMLVDLTPYGLTGKAVEKLLDAAHITANKNTIPNDPQSPFVTSGIRLGTPAVTSRGLNTEDMDQVAEAIAMVIKGGEEQVPAARAIVQKLTDKYPLI